MDKIMFTISQAQDYIVYTDKCKIITRNILKKITIKCFGDVKMHFYLILNWSICTISRVFSCLL